MRKLIFILTSIVLLAVGCERKFLIEPGHHHGNEIYLEIDLDAPLDEEFKIRIAREKLGMCFPDEIIFYGDYE